ncbi:MULTISPECIES: TetR/AcrR family transcriptional regulator [Kitasatospora]|uniref:Putative TetR family transcriptional regulator n=1 Tax=Kitasatospora setae (strain ATCC 33774 / DSM 43861 / JCM 3304 / KCC A-0304 / NBRC 14216 / KM-6054) TaxID=452652 RepID=E4N0V1_KITSK|nr:MULTISPECIES: TetR/AcrR family transcriptional regulator [Kitasatospora]BAJ31785.1 putative TetR family transcriptional regulator [Kitasatospora setae KM-6054]
MATGLRATKKQQTRTAIADAALPLFLAHGFDRVTVAEVARHAGVSTNTVFNYFPTKEDLFFDRQAEVERYLAALVDPLPAGSCCPAAAVRDDLCAALGRLDPAVGLAQDAAAFFRTVEASPALRAREREIGERAEAALAAALRTAAPGAAPSAAPLLAGALAGLHRAALRELRRRVLAGDPPAAVAADLTAAVTAAFAPLCAH